MSEIYSGQCLCGDVRFEARGKPKWVRWCHCESCRRHSGAPASVFVAFENGDVKVIHGAIARYKSSPGTERGFCARCGSTLTCANQRLPTETHYYIGAFERAAELKPSGEFYGAERLPWLVLHD
jgi:hypothetical protein